MGVIVRTVFVVTGSGSWPSDQLYNAHVGVVAKAKREYNFSRSPILFQTKTEDKQR
jgi:hypothetical protein